jgi:type II secretory pathway predicted ATPase ExeA
MERGFARLIGIVLIGQLELLPKLNDPTLREVHQRCAQVIMHGLNGATGDYLEHKFQRAGAKAGKLITPDAVTAIEKLCRHKLDGSRWFGPYPLGVNVIVKAALNLAARTGEKIVTPEIIDAAWGSARQGEY